MVFINWTGTIGLIVGGMTQNMTGQVELTVLLLAFVIIFMALAFRVPLEYTAILILPLFLATMAYYHSFIKFGAIILFYLALVFVNSLIFRR